jgi:predicted permease
MLKFVFRALWRNRLFTLLNTMGLAIGVSACWVVFLLFRHEFAFEGGLPDRDRIFRVVSDFVMDGQPNFNAGAPRPMARALASELAGVEMAVPVFEGGATTVRVPQGENAPPRDFEGQRRLLSTTNQYFQMLPYRWLAGSPADFDGPAKVVLSRERAAMYFPNFSPEHVLGRSLLYQDTLRATVVGVVEALGFNTDFDALEMLTLGTLRQERDDDRVWASVNSGDQTYLKLRPGADLAALTESINSISRQRSAEAMKRWGANITRSHRLLPLRELHFATQYADSHRKANKTVLYGLLGIAGFLLLLACINFINLATAQLPARAKEIGIRKTLGSGRAALLAQFMLETLCTGLLGAALGYGLVRFFVAGFPEFIPDGVSVHAQLGQTALFLLGLLGCTSLLAGLYPGWLAAKVQPSRILRGSPVLALAGRRVTLRKGLIVFQFAIAQLFMLLALVVGRQLHFGLTHELGFRRDAVLTCSVPLGVQIKDADNGRRFGFCEAARNLPGVASVSLGDAPVSMSYSSNTFSMAGKNGKTEAAVYRKLADTAYIGLYEMPLLAGRNLLPADTTREYVINETCARAFGFEQPADAVGAFLTEGGDTPRPLPVVGVVRDFHTAHFSEKIPAVALMTQKEWMSDFNIRLASARPADWAPVLAELGKLWAGFYPNEPFEPKFYDDALAQIYETERQTARIINLVTAVAVLISCLGLFGLATLTAFQRTKEIGVRKVLGASAASVVALLSRDFLKLVLLALLIAAPLAYYLMQRWLEDFAYRIPLSGWMFVAVGLAAALIAFLTIGFQSIRAALANPADALRSE